MEGDKGTRSPSAFQLDLFVLLVGDSSKARKGTNCSRIALFIGKNGGRYGVVVKWAALVAVELPPI